MSACGSFPHCRADAAAEDKFCAACRARLDDIIRRCFPRELGSKPRPRATVEQNAALIARFIHANGGTVTASALRSNLGLGHIGVSKAASYAREQGWIVVKRGTGAGYGPGEIKPPE